MIVKYSGSYKLPSNTQGKNIICGRGYNISFDNETDSTDVDMQKIDVQLEPRNENL